VVARCRDLHRAIGLASVEHGSPSALDVETLRYCGASLPREFLKAFGVTEDDVERLVPAQPSAGSPVSS